MIVRTTTTVCFREGIQKGYTKSEATVQQIHDSAKAIVLAGLRLSVLLTSATVVV